MRIIIAGRGGQGVITLNYIIGYLATMLGHSVISAETHGMAMRGGSVYTSMNINGGSTPTVAEGSADLLLSLDISEIKRNLHLLSKDGLIIADGEFSEDIGGKTILINAKEIASTEFKTPIHASTILLGVMIKNFSGLFPIDKSIDILKTNNKINQKALQIGLERVQ